MSEIHSGTVGKYRLIAELGHGGMADVYLAVGSGIGGFNKLLVIKVMRNLEEGSFLTMFLDEARLAARLNHPNVVQTYEVGQDDDRYFLAMEFLDGPSYYRLRTRALKTGGVPLPLSLFILSNVLQGLEYAHELKDYDGTLLNVVHRDLSPHNVLVTYEGEVKIVDFGIAKAADSSFHTQGGIFKGKLTYAPPEQMAGARVDQRADVFAVGIMLWEAAANARMWAGLQEPEIAQRVVKGLFPRLLEVNPNAPKRLVEIVESALRVNVAERCPSARALRMAIDDYARQSQQVVGRRELADYEAKLFALEREKMRKVIETQLKAIKQKSTLEFVAQPLPRATFQTGSKDGSSSASEAVTATPFTKESREPAPSPVAPPPARNRRLLPLAGGAVLLLSGTLALTLFRAEPPPALPPVPVPVPVAVAAPVPDQVEFELSATPASARLTLDGAVLATNPFRGKFAKGSQEHRVRAIAEGFVAAERPVAFTANGSLELALEPVAPTAPDAAVPVAKKPPVKVPPAGKPVQKPAEEDLGF
jgi:serine/threonine-protein kinase